MLPDLRNQIGGTNVREVRVDRNRALTEPTERRLNRTPKPEFSALLCDPSGDSNAHPASSTSSILLIALLYHGDYRPY